MNDVHDRTVIVTGASGGIGRSIAVDAARHGWHVVLASRARDGLEATAERIHADGGAASIHPLDVTDADQIEGLRRQLADDGRTVHGLVNNSGIAGPSRPLWEIEDGEWDACIAVNLRGVFLMCRAFLPAMIEAGAGSVVNIGSISGKNPLLHRSAYTASKASLIGLTKTAAADAGPRGVRVNLVSPGGVAGERLDWVMEKQSEALGQPQQAIRERLTSQSALHRFVEPEEVAAAVTFLLSDEAAGITGIDVTVAAGFVMN
ncbi:SDR family NAD(P)-dependent oxidoreductase [Aeromicrobium piscarium]|uniref:SDR family oxidoreductase n=1 Tax=Aeromicrobium piscarium TaxID=2590901 RepID=A0A554SQ58_9ACTN|nr:SDR family NAD(P)-dependent oxidoreductase [Aeromicrobium piscarium]TSD68484.1 SDR family oxidoreductase [Aeromicrobium piscarium]